VQAQIEGNDVGMARNGQLTKTAESSAEYALIARFTPENGMPARPRRATGRRARSFMTRLDPSSDPRLAKTGDFF